MDWRPLFSSAARASRKQFWTIALLVGLFDAVARFIIYTLGDNPLMIALVPFLICAAVITINNSIKRLHDFGRSGWWLLTPVCLYLAVGILDAVLERTRPGVGYGLLAICALGVIGFAIWLGVTPSDPAANRFGPPAASEPAADSASA